MSFKLRCYTHIIPFVLGCVLVSFLYIIDNKFFPVIENFAFSHISYNQTTNEIKGSGYLTKVRNCDYIAVVARGIDLEKENHIELKIEADTDYQQKMGLDAHSFGTFTLKIPDNRQFNQIQFIGLYKCHPFWVTSTQLKQIPAPRTIYTYEGNNGT